MINGSDMLNVRKSMQSSTLQTIKDIQELVEHSTKTTIPVFIPKLLYYMVDWDTMCIFFRSRHYYAVINPELVKLNGVEGFILSITVDKSK